MLQILSNFMEIKSNKSIIYLPNLNEIESREHTVGRKILTVENFDESGLGKF